MRSTKLEGCLCTDRSVNISGNYKTYISVPLAESVRQRSDPAGMHILQKCVGAEKLPDS